MSSSEPRRVADAIVQRFLERLEDAPAGVQAGVAAGMRVIAILTTHDRSDLPHADAYIASLHDLWPAVESIAGPARGGTR